MAAGWLRAKGKWLWAGAALLAGMGLTAALMVRDPTAEIPTHQLSRGEFLVTLFESGEIQAARGEKVSAPQMGGLKIVYLWPEGEKVEVGDLVIQFDPTEYANQLQRAEESLRIAQADLTSGTAQLEQRMEELKMQVEQRQASLELARLSMKKLEYGTQVEREEAQISLEKAERALEETRANLAYQEIVNRVELGNYQMRVAQQQQNYDRARKDYEVLNVRATQPGIVVYEKIRKGGDRWEKVRVGDQVWGNMTLLSLPDLSQMQVLSQIGEVDIKRVQAGQDAFIRLDAFPGPVFHGKVIKVAPMANPREDAPNVQVFEMVVEIEEQDDRLKPGMSASVEVVVEEIPDALSVPLEAVFEREEKTVVYCLKGRSFTLTEVRLGKRNAVAALVDSGLTEGQLVALEPPQSL